MKISEKQYYYWQRRVRQYAAEQAESQLTVIPAKVSETVAFTEVKFPAAPMLEKNFTAETETSICFKPDVLLRKGGLTVGISNSVSESLLGRIMEVLHAC